MRNLMIENLTYGLESGTAPVPTDRQVVDLLRNLVGLKNLEALVAQAKEEAEEELKELLELGQGKW